MSEPVRKHSSRHVQPMHYRTYPGGLLEVTRDVVMENEFGWRVEVPAGFLTDGASIPRVLWPLIGHPCQGEFLQAAVCHDLLCHHAWLLGSYEHRVMADAFFFWLLGELKVAWWKQTAMYLAVRLWGRWSYRPRSVEDYLEVTGGADGTSVGMSDAARDLCDVLCEELEGDGVDSHEWLLPQDPWEEPFDPADRQADAELIYEVCPSTEAMTSPRLRDAEPVLREELELTRRELAHWKQTATRFQEQGAQSEHVQRLLEQSRLPEKAITSQFRRMLLAAQTDDERMELIRERRELIAQLKVVAPVSLPRRFEETSVADAAIVAAVRGRRS